jgi:hypothetical protein
LRSVARYDNTAGGACPPPRGRWIVRGSHAGHAVPPDLSNLTFK